ncbi:hypothetical protein ASG11_18105 [Sphingomonas sp. Leaf357]|uniref:hypothetical protein n=1 Tax=Sphingomonas sp. Leaf357 TaxID=1736350 RepID=UPI000700F5E3|nr:hypothetical protein [Sphingomonas sp. Leaf357]KQS01562.1 hypothetical protein ASG11_18105 [Sphingomonas sp. Leaf357]
MPAPRTAIPRSPPAIAALLLIVALLIRCRDFGNPVIHVDEQFYLLVGDRMLHGALPYIDIWDRKPVGLFLIFSGIRLLPGDGILAYQLVATFFAAATAWLVHKAARRLGAPNGAALAAAIAYILWLSLLSGRGGQSPVFYNLLVIAAALLTLRLPELAARQARRAIIVNGAAACALAGLAIQTKYTPAVEGAFFGLAHLWYLRRAGGSLPTLALSALLWIALAIAPTAAVALDYWRRGPAVFDAFWFSNFASITLRKGYPAGKIVGRLAGNTAVLSPLLVCTVLAWRTRPWSPGKALMFGWLAAALIAFAMIGAFFDHYALPLLAPLAILSAPILARHRIAIPAMFALGLALFVGKVLLWPTDAEGARALARVVKANSGHGCPYVFAGDSITYLLADACLPTPHVFPSTLAYEPERGASGVDEVAEVRRILSNRPPVIVTMDSPMAEWNLQTLTLVETALKKEYRLVFRVARDRGHSLVYLRNDRPFARPDGVER